MNDLNLDAYFERIGWNGGTQPSHATLAGLLDAHTRCIPFENLDVLLGRPIRLDPKSLQDKLVRERRGGYCFEHGCLFEAVLRRLGFDVVSHTARVILITPRDEAPRAHMFLVVTLPEGRFVADPGFGALAPRFPVPLDEDSPRDAATHWMARDGRYRILKARSGDKLVDAWITTLDADNAVDFAVGNHYTATHPASPFVNRLMLRAFAPDGAIVSGMNRDITIRRGEEAQILQLADRRALRDLLARHFGFDLPEVERLRVPTIPEWT